MIYQDWLQKDNKQLEVDLRDSKHKNTLKMKSFNFTQSMKILLIHPKMIEKDNNNKKKELKFNIF